MREEARDEAIGGLMAMTNQRPRTEGTQRAEDRPNDGGQHSGIGLSFHDQGPPGRLLTTLAHERRSKPEHWLPRNR